MLRAKGALAALPLGDSEDFEYVGSHEEFQDAVELSFGEEDEGPSNTISLSA